MRSIWEIAEPDETAVADIVKSARVPPLLAQCLLNRGFTEPNAVDVFLHPKLARLSDPFLLPNMQAGVERLFKARDAGERVVIFGDYDVDGVTSCTILNESLGALGWQTATYLPHRMDEGYGLSLEATQKCLAELKPQLVLAVDCGSTNIESIDWINEQNVDVLVLDHHQVPQPAPAACALINPQLATEDEPDFRELCSAGLAFKLLHAIVKEGRAQGISEMESYDVRPFLDLVALGTIADLVPLVRENRILAVNGLKQLNATNRLGLRALIEAARIQGAIGGFEVGFQLGPRL
ncbi:MAG TPA: single-stranded-DNA-specific exonuclease RecJ, partial [Verrucomicrobiales bacterium]|nr:single-stranded-DNA-specific exonuclease RecJ [Verrucomicrobiales bacterium]